MTAGTTTVPGMRRISRLLLPAVLFSLVLSTLAPAHAAPPDSWFKWNLGDVWIRSLDYVTPTQLVAASETDGVFTASSAAGPWTNITGNLPTLGKQVHQAAGKGGQIFLATSLALYKGSGNGTWTKLGVDDATAQDKRLDQGGVQSVYFPGGDTTNIVVATAGAGDDGVFYSSDSGKTWTKATGLTSAAFYLTGAGPVMYAAAPTGVYISGNGGKSWTLSSDGIPPGESVKRVAIVAGKMFAATTGGVYRSDTGGATWYEANGTGDGALLSGEVRAFQVVGANFWTDGEPKMIVGGAHGVWATADGGESWARMTSSKLNEPGGIAMAQESVYSLNVGFGTPGSLMAGTQGHGIFTLPLSPVELPASIPAPNGSPVRNQILTANPGIWAGTGPFVYSYQWKRCTTSSAATCSNISGETDRPYQIVQADVGKYLRVGIRATNLVQPGYSAEVLSDAVGPIAAPAGFEPTPPPNYPKLLNAASAPWGVTMTIDPSDDATERWRSNGFPMETTFQYFWYRCALNLSTCDLIPDATGISYTTTVEDVDHVVEARVVGTIAGTKSPSRLAGDSGAVYERKPVNTAAPRVVGKPYVGRGAAVDRRRVDRDQPDLHPALAALQRPGRPVPAPEPERDRLELQGEVDRQGLHVPDRGHRPRRGPVPAAHRHRGLGQDRQGHPAAAHVRAAAHRGEERQGRGGGRAEGAQEGQGHGQRGEDQGGEEEARRCPGQAEEGQGGAGEPQGLLAATTVVGLDGGRARRWSSRRASRRERPASRDLCQRPREPSRDR